MGAASALLVLLLCGCRFAPWARTLDGGPAGTDGGPGATDGGAGTDAGPGADAGTDAAVPVCASVGTCAYVCTENELFRVDEAAASLTLVGSLVPTCYDLAAGPLGLLYLLSAADLYAVDQATAATTFIGDTGLGYGNGLTYYPTAADGALYTVDLADDSLYSLDPDTAAATFVASLPYPSSGDLAWVPDGRPFGTLYMTAVPASATDALVSIDVFTGTTTVVGFTGFFAVWGLYYVVAAGQFTGFTEAGDVVFIDPLTGAGTLAWSEAPRMFWGAARFAGYTD